MSEYQLLAAMEHAFDHVVEASLALVDAYDPTRFPLWTLRDQGMIDPAMAKEWLMQALTDYWYQDGQDGRTTRPYIGLIAGDETLMARVREVNQHKKALSSVISQIREHHPSRMSEIKATLPFRHPLLHDHMMGAGLARLHLKQCWRHIPVAPAPVDRVRFAWYTSGRSIKKLNVAEVDEMLSAFDADASHIRIQRQTLASLPTDEPLAQIQAQAPLMRANLFYTDPLEDGRTRQAMNVSLPLFVPARHSSKGIVLPQCNLPPTAPKPKRTRAQRSDAQIEDDPIIPSLRIHRYRRLPSEN
ncbi:hypothetical protein LMG33818_000328 [Halomonadaceae bacterium LMG 33818]|uniref:DNA replication terminus site-binding protein n=1 Tax=Cernens ardua TaxID=3402176 RepID=UPI003EDBEBAB